MKMYRGLFCSLIRLILAGCSANPIYSTTGVVLANYSEDEATPYVMQMSDPRMACALGEGIDPLLYSFSRVTDAPERTGSLLMLLAGNCAEYRAWEAELDYLRADYAGDVPAAKDAREKMKRLNAETARRRYESFQRAMAAYDFDPGMEELECPFLFNDQEELTFLLGLLTGMQAIVNDASSGAMAGVPRNIAPQAERAVQCLDNEKWGGLPTPSGRWFGFYSRTRSQRWRRIHGGFLKTAQSWVWKPGCAHLWQSRLWQRKHMGAQTCSKTLSLALRNPRKALRCGKSFAWWMTLPATLFAFPPINTGRPNTAIERLASTSAE